VIEGDEERPALGALEHPHAALEVGEILAAAR
jgi:hypothetical protein